MEKIEENNKIPRVTVITPTYNRADLIVETIESVLSQNYKDFEYFILDDGSTDNTEKVVKPYLQDKRVKYLKHKNVGEAETVNWGWALARGEYFTQVNSDDPILPGLFSEMVKVLDEKNDVVVVYPNFYFINNEGDIIKKDEIPKWNFIEALSTFSCYAASAGTFIRKTAFSDWKRIKRPKFRYINDVDMYWRMALVGDFFHIPKFLATWRLHGQNISAERYKSILEVRMWFEDYFSQNTLPEEIMRCKEKVRKSIFYYCMSLFDQEEYQKMQSEQQQLMSEYQQLMIKHQRLENCRAVRFGNKIKKYTQKLGIN